MDWINATSPLLFFIIGLVGIGYSLLTLLKSLGAKKWQRVSAEIIASSIDISCDIDNCTYGAKINYRYTYNEKVYLSDKIAFGYLANSIKYFAMRVSNQYSQGSTAIVHINPQKPESSVLLVGFHLFHLFNLCFFIVFTLIAVNIYD